MGRSNFNSVVARAYSIFPVPQVTADVTGTTDYVNTLSTGTFIPASAVTESDPPQRQGTPVEFAVGGPRANNPLRAGVATRQGAMWSLVAGSGAAGAQTLAIRNNTTLDLTAAVAIPAGAQTHISGLIEGSWRAASAGGAVGLGAANRIGAQNPRGSALFVDSTDASHVVTRPALGMIYTAPMFSDGTTIPLPPDRPGTFFPGAVKGFYITVPMGDANLASGQTGATVRAITCPIKMKLHEVCFSTSVSGAGNSVALFNVTQNVFHTNSVAMTSATAASTVVAAGSLLNRTINKGDVLLISATTAGTGLTACAAILTGHTLDHFHITSPHLDTLPTAGTPSATDPANIFRNQSGAWIGRTGFSGPCKGGAAFLQLPISVAAISQTDFPISRIIAPFDCFTFGAILAYRASAAGNSYAIRNITKSLDILATTAAVNVGTVSVTTLYSALTNNAISKGDTIELRVTTAGTAGFAAIGGALITHVRGHVNTNPALD